MNMITRNDHISFYINCHSSESPLWFMLINNQDAYFLKEEFEEPEHLQFPEITKLYEKKPNQIFSSRAEGLQRALEIVNILRPLANTRDLEEEINLYKND